MTGIPPPRHAIVHGTPVEKRAILVRAIQAAGYLGPAKLTQPDGIGQVRASATNGRGNLR